LNLRAVYSLAVVLTRSQIRGTQRSKFLARIFGEPRIILPIDITLLLVLGGLGFAVSGRMGGDLRVLVTSTLPKAFAGIPSAIMFVTIIFGVLYEISQPIQSLNTDLVNWLPMTPMEYVGGSTLSETYIYSFLLCLFLGALLGPALTFGMAWIWLATAVLSVLALFIGSFVVEILDATTNRISSSFYRKSGRSGIVFRLVATVVILVLIQLGFSGPVMGYLLESVIQASKVVWFVPVVWPSLAVLSISEANVASSVFFSGLSILFAIALFVFAGKFRARFWVPVPVSIKLSTSEYHPGSFRLPFLGVSETALVQKDLRSLTRRREMARFLAIPFVMAVSIGFALFSFNGTPADQAPPLWFLAFLYLLAVVPFVAFLSMTSIGQEGYAVWNIYAAPIKPNQLLRAKILFVDFLGLPYVVGLLIIFVVLLSIVRAYFGDLLLLGILAVLDGSALGIWFAARFPDFREMVRSRYVGVWGSLAGLACAGGVCFLTYVPLQVSIWLYGSIIPPFALASLVAGLTLFAGAFKLAERRVARLLQNLTV